VRKYNKKKKKKKRISITTSIPEQDSNSGKEITTSIPEQESNSGKDTTVETVKHSEPEPEQRPPQPTPKQDEEPPITTTHQPKVEDVPKHVEPEVVKQPDPPKPHHVEPEPPKPTPKHVEPEVVKQPDPPKPHHVEPEPPKPTPKHVEQEPPKPTPKRVKPEPSITTTKRHPVIEQLNPTPKTGELGRRKKVEVEPQDSSKKSFHEQLQQMKNQNIEISEENNLKNIESINLMVQTSDIDTIEINSDSDLANYIIQSINKAFEPFWDEYMKRFDPTKFTGAGRVGWDGHEETPRRMIAREPINRMKNIECIHLSRLSFTTSVTDVIHEKVSDKISGVSRQLIRSGIRKHIRLMLQDFIYRNYN